MPRDPGRDWTKNSYPGTRLGLKVESHPGAGQGAGQRFQPPAGTRTQISVPRRPLAWTLGIKDYNVIQRSFCLEQSWHWTAWYLVVFFTAWSTPLFYFSVIYSIFDMRSTKWVKKTSGVVRVLQFRSYDNHVWSCQCRTQPVLLALTAVLAFVTIAVKPCTVLIKTWY